MRRLTSYIAATLDRYLAGPGGPHAVVPVEGEQAVAIVADFPGTTSTPARGPLGVADRPATRFDTPITGRGTYEPGFEQALTRPYTHLR
ncbi:hypothetical protein [Streptomyces tanashiensis]|uniref:Uncharacterized protein n=1 Tax=Streptomyces tanashiensis TaxID=67367 RepID=A0ABY6QSD7_9ACTN|nr:hypothetical protein [Streptomyces tanashiensis]UZX20552.1 hypothetical protein LDH80_07430 [Streptomyces tanashiensis]GGY46231.1 hypothetical protein GCM10010299_60390 [Streptomyces tanashiensis]